MGAIVFTQDELMKLKGHLTTKELMSLAHPKQEGVTLELVSRARRILSGSDDSVLRDAIENLTVRFYLMFKVLEKKGLLSEDEMLEQYKEEVGTDEIAEKETPNERTQEPPRPARKPRRAQVFRAGTGGSIKKKDN